MQLTSPAPGRPITSPFGPRRHPVTGRPGNQHNGIDYGGAFPVLTAGGGRVVTVAHSATGLGHYVIIEHNGSLRTVYAHGRDRSPLRQGDWVDAGRLVFTAGSTGQSTGNHLHFEVRVRNPAGSWLPVNPAPYLLPAPALVPVPTAPIRKRHSMSTLYHQAGSNPSLYALAGESPGTPANWLETSDYNGLAVPWARVHGSAVTLTKDTYTAFKGWHLQPLNHS